MIFGAMVDIAVISVVLAGVSQAIQAKFMDRTLMKKQQEEMKKKQEKMRELMKKNDAKSKNELDSLQKEMLDSMNDMMSKSSKVMLVSLVIFLPAFALFGMFYGKEIINLPIPLPWLANGFDLFNIGTWGIEIYPQTNWFGWYFLTYLIVTLLFNVLRDATKNFSFATVNHGAPKTSLSTSTYF